MPEIAECRYCARCCGECIFLQYSPKEYIFNCLIYRNKWRKYIPSYLILNGHISQFFKEIVNIVEKRENVFISKECHNFICETYSSFSKVEKNMRDSWYYQAKIRQIKDIPKARKLIPNFDILVEILNA